MMSDTGREADGQADNVVAFEHKDRQFESSHHQSSSPPGSTLVIAGPFLKMICVVISLIMEVEHQR